MVKISTANAGDMGSIPGPGKAHIPRATGRRCHAPQVLIQRSRACEPQLLSPGAATAEVGAP